MVVSGTLSRTGTGHAVSPFGRITMEFITSEQEEAYAQVDQWLDEMFGKSVIKR